MLEPTAARGAVKKAETVPTPAIDLSGGRTPGGMMRPRRESEVASKGSVGPARGPGAADDEDAAAVAEGNIMSGQTLGGVLQSDGQENARGRITITDAVRKRSQAYYNTDRRTNGR